MERIVAARLLAVLAVAALVAGCFGSGGGNDSTGDGRQPGPTEAVPYLGTCQAGLLFQLTDYATTDPYLPPGFHPRDPHEFIQQIPVALGQAGVIFLAVDCRDPQQVPLTVALVGIFVSPPIVDGLESSLFDFYEVQRYVEADPYAPILAQVDWPAMAADVVVGPGGLQRNVEQILNMAINDEDGSIAQAAGPATANVDVGTGIVRFWHEGEAGLAYFEVDSHLDSRVGSAVCTMRAGTPMATFMRTTSCPPGDPVVAAFPGLAINATAAFLDGVEPR